MMRSGEESKRVPARIEYLLFRHARRVCLCTLQSNEQSNNEAPVSKHNA